MLKNIKSVLDRYDIDFSEDGKTEFYFMKRSHLHKIAEIDDTILECRHNESPTIKEFISLKEPIFLDGRVEIQSGKIIDMDIDTVYVPLEFENKKFNKIMEKIGGCEDSIQKISENYKDYICLWWD